MGADALANARNRAANIAWIAANPAIVAAFNMTATGAGLINLMRSSSDTMGGQFAEVYRLAGGDGLKIPQVQAQYFKLQSGGLLAGVGSFISAFPSYVPVAVGIGAALVGAGGVTNLFDSFTSAPATAAAQSGAQSGAQQAMTGAADLAGAANNMIISAPTGAGAAQGSGFLSTLFSGATNMGGLYDTLNGAITDIAGTLVSTYGAVQGVQLQKAQIDLATAQAQAAQRAATYTQSTQTAAGGAKINWTMIGLAVAAVLGITVLARAK